MRSWTSVLKERQIDFEKLQKYGFKKINEDYLFKIKIKNNMQVIVKVHNENLESKVIDLKSREEYILVDLKTTLGEYASLIKAEYENIMQDIINKCTIINVFQSRQAQEIMKYIQNKYQRELEYLWEKYDAAIWRNNKNQKWFGLLMVVSALKLGFKKDERCEIINLRYPSSKMPEIINNQNILPGYHMNKKNWLTIILDNSLDDEKIFALIDLSYDLVAKK